MYVFVPIPFRNSGTDYPYGYQDIANDTLARGFVTAGLVIDATKPGSVSTGVAATSFTTTLLNAVVAGGAGPSFSYPGGGPANFDISCSNWNGAIATIRRSTDGGSTWNALSGDYSSFSANGGCTLSESLGVLLHVLVTGTPGAAMTATLSR
jgi:hypothetical protein